MSIQEGDVVCTTFNLGNTHITTGEHYAIIDARDEVYRSLVSYDTLDDVLRAIEKTNSDWDIVDLFDDQGHHVLSSD